MSLCNCGCGNTTNKNNKYIIGHAARGRKRTEIQKSNYRAAWTTARRKEKSDNWIANNPMKLEKNRERNRGSNNPAKRAEVRKKISDNNAMKNPEHVQKIINHPNRDKIDAASAERLRINNPAKNKVLLEKRINTYTSRLATGKYTTKNNWKTGYFSKASGEVEWFDSSLEQSRMEFYESHGLTWTKKHGIRIPYVSSKGVQTFYVPDFLLEIDGKLILEEMKGWIKEADKLKAAAAIEYCKGNGMQYNFYVSNKSLPPAVSLVQELSYVSE